MKVSTILQVVTRGLPGLRKASLIKRCAQTAHAVCLAKPIPLATLRSRLCFHVEQYISNTANAFRDLLSDLGTQLPESC